MATSKPVATISYNSESFLKSKLDSLVSMGVLQSYLFIHHMGEGDSKKDHFHVWMSPNRMVDKNKLKNEFIEIDLNNPLGKPLGVVDIKPSKIDDWVLYCLHDREYLYTKGLIKEYHYSKDDIKGVSQEFIDEAVEHAFTESAWALEGVKTKLICEAVETDNTYQLYKSGLVRLGQASGLRALKKLFDEEKNTQCE